MSHCGRVPAPKGWKEFIKAPDNPDEMKGIREMTRTGRPLGTNDFVERIEGQLKRLFKLRPKGRPKREVGKGERVAEELSP